LLSVSFQKDSHPYHSIHGIIHDITNIKKAEQANVQAQKLAANERLIRILAHGNKKSIKQYHTRSGSVATPAKMRRNKESGRHCSKKLHTDKQNHHRAT
jgi:hypothetical protein